MAFRNFTDDTFHAAFHELPGERILIRIEGVEMLVEPFRAAGGSGGLASEGAILAPMPGKVSALDVAQGDTVNKGQRLMVLEAMKMEHPLRAPYDGIVSTLNVTAGKQVQVEDLLAEIEKVPD